MPFYQCIIPGPMLGNRKVECLIIHVIIKTSDITEKAGVAYGNQTYREKAGVA